MSYFTLLEAILKPILDEDLLPLNHILLGKHFVRFDYENSTHCFPYDRPGSKLRLLQQALLWIADTEFDLSFSHESFIECALSVAPNPKSRPMSRRGLEKIAE